VEIKCLKEFDLGMELGQVRSVPVSLGKDMPEAVLFVYSSQGNLDPWPELFNYPKDTLKMALYTLDGVRMWKRSPAYGMPRSFLLIWIRMVWMKSGLSII